MALTLVVLYAVAATTAATARGNLVRYDAFSARPLTPQQEAFFRDHGRLENCSITIRQCNKYEGRRIDGSCNNLYFPSRGTPQGPYLRLLPAEFGKHYTFKKSESGHQLVSTRKIRTTVLPDGLVESPHHTQLLTYFLLGAISDITAVVNDVLVYVALVTNCCQPSGQSDPRCIPIEIPADDPYLRLTGERCMNLTTANTFQRFGCLPPDVPPERVNIGTPMVDLSNVYGPSENVLRPNRLNSSGLLVFEFEEHKIWPRSQRRPATIFDTCINNQPDKGEHRCHDTPVPAANGLLGTSVYFLWFYREHNRIASKLAEINPCWDDDKIFETARRINIAQHQHITFYETWATVMGSSNLMEDHIIYPKEHGHVDDYNEKLVPGVTLDFVTTTRWFHTMSIGNLKLYDVHGNFKRVEPQVELTRRTGILPNNKTMEGLTLGAIRQPCASYHHVVDTDIGERVLGNLQRISDVIAVDMQRHREFGFPRYNKYRELCGMKKAQAFEDFSDVISRNDIELLTKVYESPHDVELYTALLIEKPLHGAVIGPTLYCIMSDQLQRWRQSDRFWFEHPDHPDQFSLKQLAEIKKSSAARVMCDSGDEIFEIQSRAFELASESNPMKHCKEIPSIDIMAWKDRSCQHS